MDKKLIIEELKAMLAKDSFITKNYEFVEDRRKRFDSDPLVIVKPKSQDELIKLVKFANKSQTPIITQGGNTSLQAGAITNNKGNQILMLTTGLSKIISIDKVNSNIILEAGVYLPDAQKFASCHDLVFPQMLGANINSTIGGNIATNAGGVFAKRFGSTRNIVLGLEVVDANGNVISNLTEVYKDNCGYDLKQLFIGSEGTLGIITKACFKLFHKSPNRFFFIAKVADLKQLTKIYLALNSKFESQLLAFELISCKLVKLVGKQSSLKLKSCCDEAGYYFILIIDNFNKKDELLESFNRVLSQFSVKDVNYDFNMDSDYCINESLQTGKIKSEIWQLREKIIKAQAKTGYSIKHDISVKISDITKFIESTTKIINQQLKDTQILPFGHFGDGNLHFNISIQNKKNSQIIIDQISRLVYQNVIDYNGSVAAEHGIGRLKKDLIAWQKGELSLEYMRKIKKVFDPKNILNPDVLF